MKPRRDLVWRSTRASAPLLAGLLVFAVVVGIAVARHGATVPSATPSAPASSPASSPGSSPASSPGSSLAAPASLGPASSSAAAPAPHATSAQWHDGGLAGFADATPPSSTMIAGANDLLATGEVVLAATDTGIARSTDGGSSWRYVLTGDDLWSITRAGSGFVALGHQGGPDDNAPAVVATSHDGVSWQTVQPVTPQQPSMAFGYGDRIAATGVGANAVDVAVPDVAATGADDDDAFRSIDGGHVWVKIAGVRLDTGIDVLPDGETMYSTGATAATGCAGAVYRSTDRGLDWELLPGSCQRSPLYAVTFVDAEHGFAAGGTPAKYGGSDLVEATDDGGRTWQLRWSTDGFDSEIVRLAFTDAEHGYALSGGCTTGGNGPCGGGLYLTSDAGHTWQRAGRTGMAVASAGTVVYLSGDPRGSDPALAISTDAGQHWTSHNTAARVNSQSVAGVGNLLWWQTGLGTFTSVDGGIDWTSSTAPGLTTLPAYAQPLLSAAPHDLIALDQSTGTVWSSTDDATTSSNTTLDPNGDVQAVGLGPDGQAVAIVGPDDDCSSPQLLAKMSLVKPGWKPETRPATLDLSSDGGATWQRATTLPFPASSFEPGSLAIDKGLIALMDACANLELSKDDGRTWSTITPPDASGGCTVALYNKEIWLECPASLAHSADQGVTWTAYTTNAAGVQRLAQPLDPIGPDSAVVSAGGSLWHTTDGGGHWTQSWPALDGES